MKKFCILFFCFFFLMLNSIANATEYLNENWDSGTPSGCWPCEEVYCSDIFNGWYTDYGDTVPQSGLSTTQKNSGTRSFYNYKKSSSTSGCAITYEFDTPYPTTIYVRFYMYLGSSWASYPSVATGDPLIHWMFTNSQMGSTGFRLNLTTNDHWGDCPVGDVCLLPEGDGGTEWWDSRATPPWTSTSSNDFVQYVGAWHCFEYKMQISGSNVILTEYVDGDLTRGPFTGPGQNTSSFNKIIFHLWDNPGGSYTLDYYIDDIVVSDAYIGPIGGEDTTAPVVTYATSSPQSISADSLSISGTASDAVGVTSCKWRIGSAPTATAGTALTGTTSWSGTASGFSSGANTLYAGCADAAGNWGSSSITVNYDYTPPIMDNLSPTGTLACTSNPRNVTLSLTTNETATARMTTVSGSVAYADMTDTFTNTNSTSHSEVKSLACGASYTYYVRASDALGNVNTNSSSISFSIASPQIAGPGGLRITGGRLTN